MANEARGGAGTTRPYRPGTSASPLRDLTRAAARSLWIALPDAAETPDRLARERVVYVDAVVRGVRTHVLCGSRLVDDPRAVREMRLLANSGIRIRFRDRIPRPVAIVDCCLAVTDDGPVPDEPTVLSGRAEVEALADLFRMMWLDSAEAGFRTPVCAAPGQEEPVLEALRSGLTDEAAARRLQVSVRTYRREVAKIMRRLGARSRFEAGFRAALLHPAHLDGPSRLTPEAR